MKLKAATALALLMLSGQSYAARMDLDPRKGLASKLTWAVDFGTHLYDVASMEDFKPSLELGLSARLPLVTKQSFRLELETGFSQTLVYGSSQLRVPQVHQTYELTGTQIDFRRLFVGIGTEIGGRWFIKPQVGFEHITSKLRLYDVNARAGVVARETDSNGYAAVGLGYRFKDGTKGILSFATLADTDEQDYRITYSASF